MYAQPPRRVELERALNSLLSRHSLWVMGGDFNAQLSSLDTNGKTVNKWNWLTSLIEEKKHGIDSFHLLHHNNIAFTRYRNQLLNCDTRIDFFLISRPLISTPHLSVEDASILEHDKSSDHHPITLILNLPYTPAQPPPPPTTLFRRRTAQEETRFLASLQPLEHWASQLSSHSLPPAMLVEYVNDVIPQISSLYHSVTRPHVEHQETSIEREFKKLLQQLPRHRTTRYNTLSRLQRLNKRWREKQRKREKKKLHYAMVKGSKIKAAINRALNPTQSHPVHLLDHSVDPPVLQTDTARVGELF